MEIQDLRDIISSIRKVCDFKEITLEINRNMMHKISMAIREEAIITVEGDKGFTARTELPGFFSESQTGKVIILETECDKKQEDRPMIKNIIII